jgi:hypothetical protein
MCKGTDLGVRLASSNLLVVELALSHILPLTRIVVSNIITSSVLAQVFTNFVIYSSFTLTTGTRFAMEASQTV